MRKILSYYVICALPGIEMDTLALVCYQVLILSSSFTDPMVDDLSQKSFPTNDFFQFPSSSYVSESGFVYMLQQSEEGDNSLIKFDTNEFSMDVVLKSISDAVYGSFLSYIPYDFAVVATEDAMIIITATFTPSLTFIPLYHFSPQAHKCSCSCSHCNCLSHFSFVMVRSTC